VTEPLSNDIEVAKAADCATPEDLLTRSAREVIGRAAVAYLLGNSLTPIELLYNSNHQRRLMDSGTNAMQAVQKAAGWQVRGTQTPVTERVRQIWEITDAYRASVMKRLEEEPPVEMTPETIADILAWRDDEGAETRAFRIYSSLAKTLEEKKGWAQKAEALLALMTGVAGMEAAGYFDAMLAEMLRSPKGLNDILGIEGAGGDQINTLLNLCEGKVSAERAPIEPKTAMVIYELMGRGKAAMTEIRMALMGHAVRMVRGNEALTKKTVSDEVGMIVALRDRLSRGGEIVGGEETQEALERRLSRALSDQTIDMLMGDTNSVAERVLRATRLHGKIFGEKPQAYLEKYVAELMGQEKVETRMVADTASPPEQVKLLGMLSKELRGSDIAPRTKERLAIQAAKVQTTILGKTRLIEKLASGKAPVRDRLTSLLDLIGDGMLAEEESAVTARKAALSIMKAGDFVDSYLVGIDGKAERAETLKELQKKLAKAKVV
jgi:hypothetical protein